VSYTSINHLFSLIGLHGGGKKKKKKQQKKKKLAAEKFIRGQNCAFDEVLDSGGGRKLTFSLSKGKKKGGGGGAMIRGMDCSDEQETCGRRGGGERGLGTNGTECVCEINIRGRIGEMRVKLHS